ncbi:LysR family transcriptional regulator [Novosphingobium terrae]|uniref:LysR family transcriptional regulator n=1 Tax=Novosphingobium terrae TaxID=2726189 RepID=UPI0019822704|nr:LysR family transcriptional regulator [Novosphingobium terrae]
MAVFVDVVATGSLAAAAERRGLSPSMVGKHLRALEDRLQLRLLERTTRRQKLTEAGELFLERCREILRQVDAAQDDAIGLRGAASGLLRVSAPTSFGVTRLAPAMAAFRKAHPGVEIELALTDAPVDPGGDNVDVAFRIGPLADSGLVARPLMPFYRMIVCAAPDYLARHGVPQRPEDLSAHDCLGHTRWGLRHDWRFLDGERDILVPIHYSLRIDSGLALREAAIAGAGIILQPYALVGEALAKGQLQQVLTACEARGRELFLVYPRDRAAPAKLRAFIAFALDHFAGPA